ncbi:hypothetical protein SSTU70S_00677 [Stutzerimonas stutzeri]
MGLDRAAPREPEKYATAPRSTWSRWPTWPFGALDNARKSQGRRRAGHRRPAFTEPQVFVPAMAAEYLGLAVNFAEVVEPRGCTGMGMVWRAAAAIELGWRCSVLCRRMAPMDEEPSPMIRRDALSAAAARCAQAEFNSLRRAWAEHPLRDDRQPLCGRVCAYDPVAMAKIAVDQRTNAQANPEAIFCSEPLTIDDVLDGPRGCRPATGVKSSCRWLAAPQSSSASKELGSPRGAVG